MSHYLSGTAAFNLIMMEMKILSLDPVYPAFPSPSLRPFWGLKVPAGWLVIAQFAAEYRAKVGSDTSCSGA